MALAYAVTRGVVSCNLGRRFIVRFGEPSGRLCAAAHCSLSAVAKDTKAAKYAKGKTRQSHAVKGPVPRWNALSGRQTDDGRKASAPCVIVGCG